MKNITIDGVEYNITPVIKEIKKDYEILSLSFTNNFCYLQKNGEYAYRNTPNITSTLKDCLRVEWKIHSVKRISDNKIFTIGDFYEDLIIEKMVMSVDGNILTTYKPKIKKPIFKTEDGVDIFKGDKYWKVNNYLNLSNRQKATGSTSDLNPAKYFSTKEKAEEYILMNKPCLSLNDIENAMDQTSYLISSKLNKFRDYLKSKIQQSV